MKFKINWGTSIVLVFIAFISFIMYFVITMSTDKKFDYDLVSNNYYQNELKLQGDIDAFKNAKTLEEDVKFERIKKGVKITFPSNLDFKKVKGKVFLYRPSNKQLDFEMPIALSDSYYLLMPDKRLLDGRWNIIVDWTYNGQRYLFKKDFFY